MAMNSVQVGGVRYDQETALDKVLKGLQIAEGVFKIPVAYETYNKAAADAKLAQSNADVGGQEAQEKLAYAKGAPLGPLSKLAMGVIENRPTSPLADLVAPNSGSSQVGGPNVDTVSPNNKTPLQALASGQGSSKASTNAPATDSASQTPFANLIGANDSVTPQLGGQILDYQKKGADLRKATADAGLSEGNLSNQPTELANKNAEPKVAAAGRFNAAIKPLQDQWTEGQKALAELSDPNGVVSASSRNALLGMADEITRKNPDMAKQLTEELGGSGKLTDWLSQKLTGQLHDTTKAGIAKLVQINQAAIQDQANAIAQQMAGQDAGTLRLSPDQVKKSVYNTGALFPTGKNSQGIIAQNQQTKAGESTGGNVSGTRSAPHQQVRQNGHIYNWNPQSKRYE